MGKLFEAVTVAEEAKASMDLIESAKSIHVCTTTILLLLLLLLLQLLYRRTNKKLINYNNYYYSTIILTASTLFRSGIEITLCLW